MFKSLIIGFAMAAVSSLGIAEQDEVFTAGICKGLSAFDCTMEGERLRRGAKDGIARFGSERTGQGAYNRFQLVCSNGYLNSCVSAVETARNILKNKSLEIQTYITGCEYDQARFCGAGYMATAYPSKPEYNRKAAEFFASKGCSLSDDYLCKQVEWQKANPSSQ